MPALHPPATHELIPDPEAPTAEPVAADPYAPVPDVGAPHSAAVPPPPAAASPPPGVPSQPPAAVPSQPPPAAANPPPTAAQSPPPAAAIPPEVATPGAEAPSFRQRSQLRRRLHFLRRRRELELRDLGGLVFDLHRYGGQRPDLVEAKAAVLAQTDWERRSLEYALEHERPLRELREAGIGGVCPACGTLYASDARFCSNCGTALAAAVAPAS